VNLSLLNNRTTAAALKRNGSARLALKAGCAYRSANWSTEASLEALASTLPVASFVSSITSFGGSVFAVSAPKPGCDAIRMHSAPLTLDPSANQQEGGA
jgi:hypothetical protein